MKKQVLVCWFSAIGIAVVSGEKRDQGTHFSTALTSCTVEALSAFNVPDVTITSATDVAASGLDPAYCDIVGTVATHDEGAGPGQATFRAKLPAVWNNKYLASGPGGLGGVLDPSMNLVDLALSIRKGYAFVTNDSGHRGVPIDATWALISPGVPNEPALIDHFYRAQHQVGLATKDLVKSFYGSSAIEYSYFDGCSGGGRAALMEAMRYPDDYDGIIAEAPILDRVGTIASQYKNAKAFLNAFIPPAAVRAIDAAVTENCDAADGVVDGLIQNPAMCSFDPDSLVPQTLTQAQAAALEIFMSPVRNDRGRLLHPGGSMSGLSAPGAVGFFPWVETVPAVDPGAAQPWGAAAPLAWRIGDSSIRYLLVREPNFNTNLDWPETDGVLDRDAVRLFDKRTRLGDVDEAEKLAPFLKRGRKMILYHGYDDRAQTPYRTIGFYQELAELFGGYRHVQRHARLFMAPGRHHCGGGPGPNSFDTLTALEDWVERGIPPEGIIATKFVNDNPARGVVRTMPLCKFPEKARYDGLGDPRDAASWTCPSHDRSLLEIGENGIQAGLERRTHEREDRD
jgi:feruloyl esterase